VAEGTTDFSRGIHFDMASGLSKDIPSLKRSLSNMRGMFFDENALEKMIKREDGLMYEFYDPKSPETDKDIAFGTSITYPGLVGEEYYMTKGHFHVVLETAEVYYCLRGIGYMLMESPEGEWEAQELRPGTAVYVPGRYAHRSINVSPDEPLVTFYSFRGDAGHNYGTIETQGFRKLCVKRNGKPEFIDNLRWNPER
jgi:glucose-6-phosphate isomerase, archaeal